MIQQDHIIGHLELPRVPEQLVAGADIISNNAIEVLNYSLIYKNTINEILASSDNVITNPNQEQLIQGIVQQLADQEQLIQNIFYKQNLLYKILMYNPTINDVIEQEEEELVADLPVQNVDNNIDSISGYFIDIFNYLSNSLGGPMQVAIVSIVTLFLIGYIFKVFVNSYSVTLEGPLTNSGSIIRRAEAL